MSASSPGLFGVCVLSVVLLASCTSTPPANPPEPEPAAGPRTEHVVAEASPAGGCLAFDFEACTSACHDRDCLDWCAGTRCAELATSLHACIAPAEGEYLVKHPEPEIEMLPPGPDADPEWGDVEMPEPESEERWMQWENDMHDARDAYWAQHCAQNCSGALDADDPAESREVCLEVSQRAERWSKFAPPKPRSQPDRDMIAANPGILGAMSQESSLMGVFGGSFLSLDRKAMGDFEHKGALGQLVRQQSRLSELSECVPGLEAGGEARTFKLDLRFDDSGHVSEARAHQDSREAQCVADRLAGNIRIPARALDELPNVIIDVSVSAPVNYFGGMEGDVWGGLVGAEVGEAYGVGGLGLVGTGEGGGGTGEGTIGIGSIGGRGSKGGGSGSAAAIGVGSGSPQQASPPPPKPK